MIPVTATWGWGTFLATATMWAAMMAVMMLPTVTPWLVALHRLDRGNAWWLPAPFLAGYLLAWSGFSLLAATLQAGLVHAALASPMGVPTTPTLAGGLLLMAGVFQLTPVKDRCLTHCQSPAGFFLTAWRDGTRGAVVMGTQHGLYCVGCCWALMGLAFVAGVMNPVWMVGATVYVFVDQALLRTTALTRVSGVVLIAWSVWWLVASR